MRSVFVRQLEIEATIIERPRVGLDILIDENIHRTCSVATAVPIHNLKRANLFGVGERHALRTSYEPKPRRNNKDDGRSSVPFSGHAQERRQASKALMGDKPHGIEARRIASRPPLLF